MSIVICDIETNGLDPDTIHCIAAKIYKKKGVKLFTNMDLFVAWVKEVKPTKWVFHNGLGFDVPVINKLIQEGFINTDDVLDTFVVSRTVAYERFRTHSLQEIGRFLKVFKGDYTGGWETYNEEMGRYCIQDVVVTEAILKLYWNDIIDPLWSASLKLEHQMAALCHELHLNGFSFNVSKAEKMLAEATRELTNLENSFQKVFGDKEKENSRLQLRFKQDGTMHSTVLKAMANPDYSRVDFEGDEVVTYKLHEFNPGSPTQRIDVLWEAGWAPFEKTKGHNTFIRESRDKGYDEEKATRYARYGWTCSEENLATLPESAPKEAKELAQWLTLNGRRNNLVTWLGCVKEDGKIHGKFWHIGAWTHRMSHSDPNQANISSPFHGEAKSAVERVKKKYDSHLRSLWTVTDGATLVGTDADGIQLRILAHYLQNDAYVEAIVNGKKENETDIHNLNKRALGLNYLVRDDAKTFIYAWLLGAGLPKVANILSCDVKTAGAASKNFLERTEGLTELKTGLILRDAAAGYFTGVDGRRVPCNSAHKMLAGYLQNAEAVIMKKANILWQVNAKEAKIDFKQVDFVHDEWQTECYGSFDMCEHLGLIQRESIETVGKELGLYCPMAGSTDYGMNWLHTH